MQTYNSPNYVELLRPSKYLYKKKVTHVLGCGGLELGPSSSSSFISPSRFFKTNYFYECNKIPRMGT